jgi:eukaryotic-like serine/threonine-protein kinase
VASPSFAPGDLVAGKYRLERELGRGGMGVVYLANDLELERHVAIKILLEEHAEDQGSVLRFLREAKASVKIKSEHVAHVYETGRFSSGVPYIVMEYLQGRDLAERLESVGPLSVSEIAGFIIEACEALAEAHSAGIVHRDLKPANLFLARRPDGTDVLKILDFGISKITTSSVLTRSQTLVGSPYYMSPEQLESAQDVDVRADIWALGVIMYELCSGKRPFEGTSLAALCVTVLNAKPEPLSELLPEVAPEFEAVVLKCLQKDRAGRFQNVGELARALESLRPHSSAASADRVTKVLQNARTVPDTPRRESDPVHDRSASWAQTNRESTGQHHKGRRFVIAAVVILAAGGLGVGLGQLVKERPPDGTAFGKAPRAEEALSSDSSREGSKLREHAPAPTVRETSPAELEAGNTPSAQNEAKVAPVVEAATPPSESTSPGLEPAPNERLDSSEPGQSTPVRTAPVHDASAARSPKPEPRRPPPEPARDPFLRRH